MSRGDLEHGQILRVGKPTDKVDAAQIESSTKLGEHVLAPIGAVSRRPAVADAVAADDDDLRLRARLKDL